MPAGVVDRDHLHAKDRQWPEPRCWDECTRLGASWDGGDAVGSTVTRALPAAADVFGRTRRVSGIDVGGTFTDIVVHESGPDGPKVRIGKVPTTLPNQTDGVLAAIAEAGVEPA